MTDDQLTIDEVHDETLTIGHAPVRLAATHQAATYYILECPHGSTQLHEVEGVDQSVVTGNLVKEHHERLGCQCQPA